VGRRLEVTACQALRRRLPRAQVRGRKMSDVIRPVAEKTMRRAIDALHTKGESKFVQFLIDLIVALWEQNRDQAAYIEGMKESVNTYRRQVRQEKLF
jgi:hypothetical protein